MLQPNTILQTRYKIVRVLGGGGMATVYLAEDTRLAGKLCAVKEMIPDPTATPSEQAQAQQMFQREAAMLAHLTHTNLPNVSDYFQEGGNFYLVMDYVDGETLESILAQQPQGLTEEMVVNWAEQLCNVLGYLHSCTPPVIFRDLKPANVMLDRSGAIKLIDFGIARLFDPAKKTDTLKMGTAGYASPEGYKGQGQTTPRSDIYSLGVTLHQLLTGNDPTAMPFIFKPPRDLNQNVSARVSKAVMRAVEMDPDARFQTMAKFKAALFAMPGADWRRYAMAIGAAALLLIAGFASVRGWLSRRSTPTPTRVVIAATATPILPTTTNTSAPPTATFVSPTITSKPPDTTTPISSSTSGEYIAFVSERDGNKEIYIMNVDGSGQRNLTNNPAEDRWPAWSADCRYILFGSDRSGNYEIYVINADGSGVRSLTNNWLWDGEPSWSSDGQRIAFRSNSYNEAEIHVINVDGSNRIRLTNNSALDGWPVWSPDGQYIAFESFRDNNYEIYVMNADGSAPRNLTSNLTYDTDPAWSPDGQRIAFASDRGGNYEIYITDADGHILTNVTNNAANERWPAWSPDGQHIAFTSDRDSNWEIYVMDADGNNQINLTNNPAGDMDAFWTICDTVVPIHPIEMISSDATDNPSFGKPIFCLEADFDREERNCQLSQEIFTEPINRVYISWTYDNVYKGMNFSRKWYKDGQLVLSRESIWDGTNWRLNGSTEYTWFDAVLFGQQTFPPGNYKAELYINNDLIQQGMFSIR